MKLLFKAEFRKFRNKLLSEPLSLLPMLIFLYVFFWIITLSSRYLGGETDINPLITHNMMGYMVWFFTISAVGAIPQTLQEEKALGTYEHLNLSTVDVRQIFLVRAMVNSLQNIIIILIFTMLISLLHGLKLLAYAPSLVVFMITIPGLYGFAFILTALLIQSRQTANWLGLLNFFMIIPVLIQSQTIPPGMRTLLSYWPVYQSANILRLINLHGLDFPDLQGELLILLISSFTFFVLGIFFFDMANKRAKVKGVLVLY